MELESELGIEKNKKYKVKAIKYSAVYAKEIIKG